MKKRLNLVAIVLAFLFVLSACGTTTAVQTEETVTIEETQPVLPETIRVMALKGPTGIGLAHMMNETTEGYEFTVAASTDEVVAGISSGSVDIAAAPTNLAAVLNKKTSGDVQMIAIETYGTLYILENGNTINSVEDLRGKTLYATGQGANPEYVLNYILEKNGLVPGQDVTIEYKSEHAELATLAASGDVAIAMLPEPNVTSAMMQNADLRIALDLTEEWNKVSDSPLVMGCFIVRKSFAEEYPDAVSDFLDKAEQSIGKISDDVAVTATICEEQGIIPKAKLAEKAIPNCNFTFIAGEELQPTIDGYFNVLYAANPASVGGAIPDESFYFVR